MATQTLTGLTTIFTPPPSCSSSWTYEMESYNSIPGGLLLQNALPVDMDTDCFPSGFAYSGRVPFPIEVYSPGACPAGYVTAAESFNGDTTLAVCCQSGFSYTSTFSQKDQFNSTTVLFAGCTSTYPLASSSTVVPARSNADLNTTTVTGPIIMWGQPITIEFQQKDLTLFTTSTSSSSSTTTTTQPSSTRAQPTSSPTVSATPSPSPSSGLSTGAKAGIGVGAATCGLIILGIVLTLFSRRQKAMKDQPLPMEDHSHRWERQELDGSEMHPDQESSPQKPHEWVELE